MRTAITVALLLCTTASAWATGEVTVRAETGLGGAARPGRWTPVRVDVANAGHDFSGEILVEWGEARVHRAFEIAAPSRTTVELYIRTQDARGTMLVSLIANGHTIASTDAPVRPVADDDALIVCVGGAAADPACSVVMTPESLPRSMRGYDGADEVRVQPGVASRLAPEQHTALNRWRAYHLDGEGQSQAPHAVWTASPAVVGWSTRLACVLVLCPLLAAAWISRRARGPALLTYGALTGAIVVGATGGVIAGRVGPGSAVVVRHATSVQQVGDGCVISMRGRIEYPAFGTYAIQARPADGALTLRSSHGAEQWTEGDGTPIRRSTVGRGHHEDIEYEAVGDFAPFAVSVHGDAVRVSNVSNTSLTECHFSEGFSRTDVGTLRPGGSAEARTQETGPASFFSCAMTDPPVRVSDARVPVQMIGSAIVSVRLPIRPTVEDGQ